MTDRLERQRQRLTKAISELSDSYDPRSSAARDVEPPRSRVTHVTTDAPSSMRIPKGHPAYVPDPPRPAQSGWDGLYLQLTRALGVKGGSIENEGKSPKPGPRLPGWRPDVSALLVTIQSNTIEWQPGGKGTLERLRNLPYITEDEDLAERASTVAGWVARATLCLGYRKPAQDLPGVRCEKRHLTRSGWRTTGCGQTSLKVREGGAVVWCSTPQCHDSVEWPDCTQDAEGAWSCRDSDSDRTHAVTFTKHEWLRLWADLQATDGCSASSGELSEDAEQNSHLSDAS